MNCIKGHKGVEADNLRQLPITNENMEAMLNHPPVDPYNPLLNKGPYGFDFYTISSEPGSSTVIGLT